MNGIIKYSLLIFFLNYQLGYTQESKKLCICFDEHTKNIRTDTGKIASFSIPRKGFEQAKKTLSKRKSKRDHKNEISKIVISPDESVPSESNNYNYIGKPEPKELHSIEEVTDCALLISVEEFRNEDYDRSLIDGLSTVIFIKKINDHKFLKWKLWSFAERKGSL